MKERPMLFNSAMVRAILAGTKVQTRRIVDQKLPTDAETRAAGASWSLEQAVSDDVKAYSLNDYERLPKQPGAFDVVGSVGWIADRGGKRTYRCPYGAPGDRLVVRETWGLRAPHDMSDWHRESVAGVAAADVLDRLVLEYRADWASDTEHAFWRPSIHMPRWASRITLEITDVRVERLNSISREDAIAEGASYYDFGHHDGYPNWKRDGWSMRDVTSHDQVLGTAMAAFANEWNRIADGENWNLKDGPSAFDRDPWVWVLAFKRVTP